MDFWQRLETVIPVGEASADAAALREKAEETTGDIRSMSHMELYRIYNSQAGKRVLLSLLLRYVAKGHLRQAIRSAQYYPDPLGLHAALLGKEGDLWGSAKEFEEVIPRERAWIEVFKDPDGSRQLQLCVHLAAAGAARSLLGQFNEALFWHMEALKEFNQLAVGTRGEQSELEDAILTGVMTSLISQFRYEDALFFVERALEGDIFAGYQSDVRHELRAQRELLPELVARTRGFELPEPGLKLWADLMEEVQRCKSPEEARETRRKIMDTIETHKAAAQVRHLEDAIVSLLNSISSSPASPQPVQASRSAPLPPDLSGITDPQWRETLDKVNRAAERLRQDSERRTADILEGVSRINAFMKALNQAAIAQIHKTASQIYAVPRWFRVQWNARAIARLAVQFLAIEFLIGKVLEKLLESNGRTVLERLHFTVREGMITGGVALVLFFISIPAEQRIDEWFLASYKRLLQKLVADRVTKYWVTYNMLLRIFAGCKAEIDKLKNELEGPDGELPPTEVEQAS